MARSRTRRSSRGSREVPDRKIHREAVAGPLGVPRENRFRRERRPDGRGRDPRTVAAGGGRPFAPVVPRDARRRADPPLPGIPGPAGPRGRHRPAPPRHGNAHLPSRHPVFTEGSSRAGPGRDDRDAPFEAERRRRGRDRHRRLRPRDAGAGVHPLLLRLPCLLREVPYRRFTGGLPPPGRGGGVPRVPGGVSSSPVRGAPLLPSRADRRPGESARGGAYRRPVHRGAGVGRLLLREHLVPCRGK